MSFRTFFQRNEREHASRFVCQRDFGLEEQMFFAAERRSFFDVPESQRLCQNRGIYQKRLPFYLL